MNNTDILTMRDIQITNILYYDAAFKEACYKFCGERDIDCLPSLEDSRKVFSRQQDTLDFAEERVSDERIVPDWKDIFAPELADKFAKHPLLLVFSSERLSGVVHFSDYNQPVVSMYLYKLFLAYEKDLRTILELNGLCNRDMTAYFQHRIANPIEANDKKHFTSKVRAYERHASDIEKLPKFQSFYLLDLIELAEHSKIIYVENKVTKLRNMVMHAHDFVHMEDPHTTNLIYNPKTFQEFFELAVILHKDYKRVANHLAFINQPRTSQESYA